MLRSSPSLALAIAVATALSLSEAVVWQPASTGSTTLAIDLSDSTLISAALPSNFVSLSAEVDDTPRYLGSASNYSSSFVALMQLLCNSGATARGPTLRVGGDSSDYSLWWPAGSGALPPGQQYAITDADLDLYSAVLPLWNGRMVLGTSLYLANDTRWGAAHAAAVTAHAGGWSLIESVEVCALAGAGSVPS